MSAREVRLLVHAGAPSSVANDDAYRRQATSLDAFAGRQIVLTGQPNQVPAGRDANVGQQEEAIDITDIYEEDSQNAFTALESQLFTIADIAEGGHYPVSVPLSDVEKSLLPLVVSPAPHPPRSSLSRDPSFPPTTGVNLNTSPASHTNSGIGNRHGMSDQDHPAQGTRAALVNPICASLRSSSPEQSSLGFLNSTQLNNPQTTISEMQHAPKSSPSNHQTPSNLLLSTTVPRSDTREDTTTPETSEQPLIADSASNEPDTILIPEVVEPTTVSARQKASTPNQVKSPPPPPPPPPPTNETLISKLSLLPLTIHAPDPPIGHQSLRSQITPHLQFLETHPIWRAYAPVYTTRPIRPLERGSWVFVSSTLPVDVQIKFWDYLHQAIGAASVGWGVWCSREPFAPSETESGPHSGERSAAGFEAGSGRDTGLGRVRVFCWGETVRHVYLLLYIASHSKIRRLGLQWIDAEEHVVVQMP